jgi:hypothetical protein
MKYFRPLLKEINNVSYKYRYIASYKDERRLYPEKALPDTVVKSLLLSFLEEKVDSLLNPMSAPPFYILSKIRKNSHYIFIHVQLREGKFNVVSGWDLDEEETIEWKKNNSDYIEVERDIRNSVLNYFGPLASLTKFIDGEKRNYRFSLTDHIFKKRKGSKGSRLTVSPNILSDVIKYFVSTFGDKIKENMADVIGEKKIVLILRRDGGNKNIGILIVLSRMFPGYITVIAVSMFDEDPKSQEQGTILIFKKEERVFLEGYNIDNKIQAEKDEMKSLARAAEMAVVAARKDKSLKIHKISSVEQYVIDNKMVKKSSSPNNTKKIRRVMAKDRVDMLPQAVQKKQDE